MAFEQSRERLSLVTAPHPTSVRSLNTSPIPCNSCFPFGALSMPRLDCQLPQQPQPGSDLTIHMRVGPNLAAVDWVQLRYQVGYKAEVTLTAERGAYKGARRALGGRAGLAKGGRGRGWARGREAGAQGDNALAGSTRADAYGLAHILITHASPALLVPPSMRRRRDELPGPHPCLRLQQWGHGPLARSGEAVMEW